MEINWYFNWTNDKSNIVTPLVNRQGIYAGNVGQVALIPRDGTVAVHNDLPGLSTDEVRLAAPDDASLVVAGLHGHVVALDPVSLKERWRTNSLPDSGGEVVSVLCAAGQIYAGCNGYVFRFDPSGPQIKEQHYLDQGSHEVRLAMNHSESILFASYNSVVLALDPETLKEKWHKEMTEAGRSVVSIVSGKDVVSGKNFVYAGCRGYVYMFDESDGNQKTWNSLPGDDSNQVRLQLDDKEPRVYVGTNGHGICLTSTDLEKIYDKSLPGSWWSITDVAFGGGRAFFANNSYVFELHSDGNVGPKNELKGYGGEETRLALDGKQLIVGLNGYVISLNISSDTDASTKL